MTCEALGAGARQPGAAGRRGAGRRLRARPGRASGWAGGERHPPGRGQHGGPVGGGGHAAGRPAGRAAAHHRQHGVLRRDLCHAYRLPALGRALAAVFGPWTARIGRGGFAPAGLKREGDGRTPSGTFGFGFFFGVLPNPGVGFRYRQSQPYDFWDDDPASPRYNEWVDQRRADPGLSPEPMDVSGYDYGAVIAYNTARTPGLGSGIFLHVNIGIATAGCVTLPMGELLRVLRWLKPGRSPRIRMGVGVSTGA